MTRLRNSWPLLIPALLLTVLVTALIHRTDMALLPQLFGERWQPAQGRFGILPFVAATFATAFGALLIAFPCAFATALALHLYPRTTATAWLYRITVLSAAIPSVVWGFWGLVALAPMLSAWRPPGQGLLAATIVLALMVWPTITIALDAALARVPESRILTSLSLGLTLDQRLRLVILPSITPAAAGAALLGLTRAIGETMAVLMVSGNVGAWPHGPFASIRTVTANIALELPYARDTHRDALLLSGLVLITVTLLLFWSGRHLRDTT